VVVVFVVVGVALVVVVAVGGAVVGAAFVSAGELEQILVLILVKLIRIR